MVVKDDMQVALGPAHPLWPGPQQVLLRVAGERVADVEYHDAHDDELSGRQLVRAEVAEAPGRLAQVQGLHGIAHTLALCLALESLAGIAAPPRADALRVALAEVERLLAHTAAAERLFAILGVERQRRTLQALHTEAATALDTLAGTPAAGLLSVGGLHVEVDEARRSSTATLLAKVRTRLFQFVDRAIDDRLLLRRLVDVGVVRRDAAQQLGMRGPAARASGLPEDVRADQPYAAYSRLGFQAVTQDSGDAYARLVLLLLEALESAKLAERALADLQPGPLATPLPAVLSGESGGLVESPAGLLRYQVVVEDGRLRAARVDAPRQLDRLLARTLLDRALLDNSLLILASAAPGLGSRS